MSNPGVWPDEDKEWLGRCILCGSTDRTLEHGDLEDKVTRAAPGRWSLHRCGNCALLYLDPRPHPAAIGRAYAGYYTHADAPSLPPWHWPGRRAAIRRAYLNARYGHALPGALPFGQWLMRVRPRSSRRLDITIRHLPPPSGPDATLLDIGCGNGDFLDVAQELGYRASGMDADAGAVSAATRRGHDVRIGLLPGSGFAPSSFDHVTLSHVLEHFHQPREALVEIFGLLRPGGRLWITQPNPESDGHRGFGPNWRGLEPPRHMALYPAATLAKLLSDIGYARIATLPTELAARFYFRQSMAIAADVDPYRAEDPPGWEDGKRWADAADAAALRNPERAESLTMIAYRPAT